MNARLFVLSAVVALAGCTTILDAWEKQRELQPKGEDAAVSVSRGKVSLRGYSLEQMVAFAMTNRPDIARQRLAVRDSRLALKALAAEAPLVSSTPWTAPKLGVSGGYSESSTGRTMSEGRWEMSGNSSASLSLDLLVYDFGRYGANASRQAEQVVAAELTLVNVGYAVFDDVTSSFFDFIERQALLAVALTNELQYAEHLARAEARRSAGEAYRLDVLRARLDLANARQRSVAASNLVDTSGAGLMNALGIDASCGTWETVLGSDLVAVDSVRRAFGRTAFDVEAAFDLARTNAPAMRVKRAELRAATHAVDYAVADLMPSVSVSGSLSWTNPLWYWGWGVNVAQSLFQGFRKTTAVDRAVVAMEMAAKDVDTAEQQLSVSIETAIANRDNSAAELESAVASIKSARENLDTVKEQYQLGDVSRIELSDAIAAYSQAAGDCITAFYNGQRHEAKLYALLGQYPVYNEEIVKGQK